MSRGREEVGLEEVRFEATRSRGEVGGLLLRPAEADCLVVLGHGAGAGMRHAFMERIATALAERGIASLRYQFPYMERRSGRRGGPDPGPVLRKTVRSAVAFAHSRCPGLPLFAGGKSMGGRMTSLAQAEEPVAGLRGLVFLGFPLHAAGRPSTERGEHLADVGVPTLFLQGTRDRLADLELLAPICRDLGAGCTLHVIEGGDHSFKHLKSAKRSDEDVDTELASTIRTWCDRVLGARPTS